MTIHVNIMRTTLAIILLLAYWPAFAADWNGVGPWDTYQRRVWFEQQRRREHAREERKDNTIFRDRYAPWWRMDIDRVCVDANGVRFKCIPE
jgi:hypothetical protein